MPPCRLCLFRNLRQGRRCALKCLLFAYLKIPLLKADKPLYPSSLFENCYSLKSLDLSNFTMLKAANLVSMFKNCYALTSVDLSNFDTSNLILMTSMFENCGSLKSLDLSSFSTSKVTDMSNLFSNCTSLETLTVPFDTSKTQRMQKMFSSCISLSSLDITTFNTQNCNDFTEMFENDNLDLYVDSSICPNLIKAEIPQTVVIHDKN